MTCLYCARLHLATLGRSECVEKRIFHARGLMEQVYRIDLTLLFTSNPIKLQNLSKTELMVFDFGALLKRQTRQSRKILV